MRLVNIHQAKTHLSRLVEDAARGKPFIIAKAGRPVAKVTALDSPTGPKMRRLGFLAGQIKAPRNFDRMGAAKIARRFGGGK